MVEMMALIEDYRQGLVPLIVPLTLLKHHLRRPSVPEWVHKQVYLNPYPKELMLRNHAGSRDARASKARRILVANSSTRLKDSR